MQEVLGSGSGSQPFQSYVLRGAQKPQPLTYVSAANENGAASTLEIRAKRPALARAADAVRARAARAHLHDPDRPPGPHDGDLRRRRTGARLPSGSENVGARYRKGLRRRRQPRSTPPHPTPSRGP